MILLVSYRLIVLSLAAVAPVRIISPATSFRRSYAFCDPPSLRHDQPLRLSEIQYSTIYGRIRRFLRPPCGVKIGSWLLAWRTQKDSMRPSMYDPCRAPAGFGYLPRLAVAFPEGEVVSGDLSRRHIHGLRRLRVRRHAEHSASGPEGSW